MNFGLFRYLPLIIILLLPGCSKPEDIPEDHNLNIGLKHEQISRIQGVEPSDPFSIENINKALGNLKNSGSLIPVDRIEPNHVYLRFLPENEFQLELLKNDTTLILYDFPLDSEINEGETVQDKLYSNSGIRVQYTVVPAGRELPPVNYQILYEVFIPPDEDRTTRNSNGDLSGFYEDLILESARITGNLPDTSYLTTRSSKKKWSPKGRIRVWDDLLGQYIPMNHVSVHARWFTHIDTDLTDEEGYFRMGSFRNAVNYSIKWENSFFTIRDGLFFQAWYNGPKMRSDWNLDIKEGKSKMFATIHRAAYRQFYGDNLGMFRPYLNPGGRTRICYMEGNGTGRFIGDFSAGGILPDIQVWGNSNNRATNIIFGTVSHELGHQAHSQLIGNINFVKTSKIIRESWAEAVEWAITNAEYNELGLKYGVSPAIYYDHQYNKHVGWPFVYDKAYSPIFIDLVDKINQREKKGPDHPNDMIDNYSISFINLNLLKNSSDIRKLHDEVARNKVEGVDDFKIGELFRLYLERDEIH